MNMIDHRYLEARQRAKKFDRLSLESPTYARQRLSPKVQIGILRDPAEPIRIMPAIHTPPPKRRREWRNSALWAASGIAIVMSVLFVDW